MAYRRPKAPAPRPAETTLIRRLVGIGFALTSRGDHRADLEETLVHASELGMDDGDLRVLSILTTWLEVHHRVVCVDRLRRLMTEHPSRRVRAYWAAVSSSASFEGRFEPLAELGVCDSLDLLGSGTSFLLRRKGVDERFNDQVLRVARGTLRKRVADVASPEQLARTHRGYALRVMLGSSYRAVLWEQLERDSELTPSAAGRRARSSFSTAWETVRDFRLIQGVGA